jgi:hypothetical protein
MKNTLRKYASIFRVKPFFFTAIIVLIVLSSLNKNWPVALAMFLVLISEVRVVMLTAKVKILTAVAGSAIFAAMGSLFSE